MRHLILATLMLTACGAVVLAAKDQPALAADPGSADARAAAPAAKDGAAKKDQPAKKDEPTSKPAAGTPVNKFCPIDRENGVDPKVTTTHDGKTIGFCCEPCIETFKADPKKYMKDLK